MSKCFYTVIGVYDGSGKVFCNAVEAESAMNAMIHFSKVAAAAGDGHELEILGAFPGKLELAETPGEGGKSSWAADLADLDEEE